MKLLCFGTLLHVLLHGLLYLNVITTVSFAKYGVRESAVVAMNASRVIVGVCLDFFLFKKKE